MKALNILSAVVAGALLIMLYIKTRRMMGTYDAAVEAQGQSAGRRYLLWIFILLLVLSFIRRIVFKH